MMGWSRRAFFGLAVVLMAGNLVGTQAQAAPSPAATQAPAEKGGVGTGITGTWQGTLHAPGGHDLRTVLKITKDAKGALSAMFYSIDQSGRGIATSSISFDNDTLKYGIDFASLNYEGKMSPDGNSISGTSTQGDHTLPLVFERATPETEWAMPTPPPTIPPMPADAHPAFEVATIKPTKPGEQRTFLVWRGADMQVVNFSLEGLIKFAYTLQDKQILGGPDWMNTEKFDIDAKPDTPGSPNGDQLKEMVQKLLADRFGLQFHRDERDMGAYVLTVGKDGPKMKQNTSNPNGLPGLFFGPIGTLHVMNATMQNFCGLMQSAVLDRPVVDHTELKGRWDFTLKWMPDESQFAGMGVKVPPPSADDPNPPPPLFTAIQEQLDLKLDAEKTNVPVVVIDHVAQPSPN